jgi:hypothetical protein
MFLLLLAITLVSCSPFSHTPFVTTQKVYNGTVSYNGLFSACLKEFKNSKPCTYVSLLNGFWNYTLPPSWILTLDNNCLGYNSDSLEVLGMCVVTSFKMVTQCSCNMYMPICCVV